MNIIEKIQSALNTFLIKTFNISEQDIKSIETALNTDEKRQQFGDASSNAALVLSKKLGKNPREIAQEIVSTFSHPDIEKIEIAGPGFLNIYLSTEAYIKLLQEIDEKQETFFKADLDKKLKFNVEFVSANPTGPLHFGHGRGGIIGDVLGNVLSFIGYSVEKEFYINDAGSQIQKLGESFKIRCLQELGETLSLPEDGYQGTYLVDLAKECIKEHGKQLTKKQVSPEQVSPEQVSPEQVSPEQVSPEQVSPEQVSPEQVSPKPDTFFAEYAKKHLLKKLQQTLSDYGITFDTWFSEKTLHENNKIEEAIKKLQNTGYIYEKDDALWFKSTTFGDDKDRVVRKKDGSWTYIAADIAYMLDKVKRGTDNLILVLGQDHHGYVDRLYGLHKALGLEKSNIKVILYQLVSLKEGGKDIRMSKRAGRMVTLQNIIDTVGKDVARFFYLNRKADAQLDFNLDLALKKTDENPVYYIQYAYVRVKSILKKANEHPELEDVTKNDAEGLTEHERLLLKKIVALKGLLLTISKGYQTHLLTYYALELAQLFHSYYSKNKVLDLKNVKTSRARLLVLQQLAMTLGLVLDLLGISKPEKM